ncbi:MAG: autotransporter assembly complex family protein [Sphingomonadaceae bacterium]
MHSSVIVWAAIATIASLPAAAAQTEPAAEQQEEAEEQQRTEEERAREAARGLEEPIISDSQFEEALPELDPELDTELVPIAEFELDEEEPAGPDAVEPADLAGAPPGGDADDVELLSDVEVEDDALLEPLPPIESFEVRSAESLPGEEEDAAADAPLVYRFVTEGFEEVGLADEFRDLSALEEEDGEAVTVAAIRALARADEELAVRLLRSRGYYDAAAAALIEPLEEGAGSLVTVSAAPGQLYEFGEIAIADAEDEPRALAREALFLEEGAPIVAAEVEAAEANVRIRLPQQGYPFVEVGRRDLLLDPETGLGDYTLPVRPGNFSRFGEYGTLGDLAFDARHVGVLARWEKGEVYDSRMIEDLRQALIATNLFSSVAIEPVQSGERAPEGGEYVDLIVRQDAGPARSLTASAGYATGEGFRVEGGWEHRNLFPPEGALRAAAVAGTREQSLRGRFRRANAGKRDRAFLLTAEAGRRDYEAFEGYTVALAGLVTYESTPIWQKVWTWAYGAELIATNENRFDPRGLERERGTYFIAALNGQLGYDRSNDLLNPTKGFRLLGRTSPEASLRGDVSPYIRNLLEGSVYQPVRDDLVVAARARLGSIAGAPRDDIAPSRRFYAGGGGSVRGFGYQELGPRVRIANPDFDPENPEDHPETIFVPIGGRSLVEFALEARYRFGNFGVVPFVDAGQVYESEYPTLDNLRFGVGIGGRLYTNFGPVRIDVAMPINRREGESAVAVYVSVGQAF